MNRKLQRTTLIGASLLVAAFATLLISTPKNNLPPVPRDVAGRYTGSFGTTHEIIDVHQDGTFAQTISSREQVLHQSGTWKAEQLGLEFFDIYIAFQPDGKLFPQPVKAFNHKAVWVDYQGSRRIAFDIERGYVLDREK